MMDENDSDAEDATDDKGPIEAATTAKVISASAASRQDQDEKSFQMRIEKPSSKPRPVIQELN
jgi:hypothetical protein